MDPAAIEEVVSVTQLPRDKAEMLLRNNDGNPNKAINAFFDDPEAAFQSAEQTRTWDTSIGPHPPPHYQGELPAFSIDATETHQPSNLAGTAPSRPPSRLSHHTEITDLTPLHAAGETSGHKLKRIKLRLSGEADPNKSMSADQRYEYDTRKAIEESLGTTNQESGVTSTGQQFGPANRDFYNEQQWAVTLPRTTTQEVILPPEPEDRRRVPNQPVFLRPSEETDHLAPLITILHSIAMAREALMNRAATLEDYGDDAGWWNGNPIMLPRIVSTIPWGSEAREDEDQMQMDPTVATSRTSPNELVAETQRLMAFLDDTTRAYGSADALAKIELGEGIGDPSSPVSDFLDKFVASVEKPRADVFTTLALKRNPVGGFSHEDKCLVLDVNVNPKRGQTLYDIVDGVVWDDQVDEELDEVFFLKPAPVFTMRFKIFGYSENKSLDVKIPAVWYPSRYSEAFLEVAQKARKEKLEHLKEIKRIEETIEHHSSFRTPNGKALAIKDLLEAAATAVDEKITSRPVNGVAHEDDLEDSPRVTNTEAKKSIEELRRIVASVEKKIDTLNDRREDLLESLKKLTKDLTAETSRAADESSRYTLRGFSTEPHLTYLLLPDDIPGDNPNTIGEGWQWWRISFSKDDEKKPDQNADAPKETVGVGWGAPNIAAAEWQMPKMKEKAPYGSHYGFSLTKIREIEALEAARKQSDKLLLVYANDQAVRFSQSAAPFSLQQFVKMDNQHFATELAESVHAPLSPSKRKRDDLSNEYDANLMDSDPGVDGPAPPDSGYDGSDGTGQNLTSLLDTDVTEEMALPSIEMPDAPRNMAPSAGGRQRQEMQEKSNGASLLPRSSTNPFRRAPPPPPRGRTSDSIDHIARDTDDEEMDMGSHDHVEYAK